MAAWCRMPPHWVSWPIAPNRTASARQAKFAYVYRRPTDRGQIARLAEIRLADKTMRIVRYCAEIIYALDGLPARQPWPIRSGSLFSLTGPQLGQIIKARMDVLRARRTPLYRLM